MTYQVVEKTSKQDSQGNLLSEMWLKDSAGGYSLLRTSGGEFDNLSLGETVTVIVSVTPTEATKRIETVQEVDNVS